MFMLKIEMDEVDFLNFSKFRSFSPIMVKEAYLKKT